MTELPTPDLLDAILRRCAQTPGRTAMVGADGSPWTFGRLHTDLLRAAAGLRHNGFRPGERVVFAVRPSPQAVVAALAVVAAGGVVVVADPGAGAALEQIRRATTAPSWALAEPVVHAVTRGPGRLVAARRGLRLPDLAAPGLRQVVMTPRRLRAGRWLTWGQLLHDGADAPRAERDRAADALVVFTSGTTTDPRAVRHTTGTLGAGAAALADRLELTPGDRVHTDQLMVALPTLLAGATWSAAPLGAPGPVWRRTAAGRAATVGYAVPATLAAAAAAGPFPATLRVAAMGGAPVTPAVVRAVQAAAPAARVVGVYGLTEALPVATVDGPDLLAHADRADANQADANQADADRADADRADADRALGVVLGHPVPGTAVGVDEAGELWVAGPQVSPGYVGRPAHDAGRVCTGDLAQVTPEGRLVLLGRAKDMILRGVTNIYPALVEPLVEAEPGVAACALVGLPDPATGDERVVLVVVARADQDGPALVARLRRQLPGLLDQAWLPDDIVAVADLPVSGRSRKVDKATLRDHLTRTRGPRAE